MSRARDILRQVYFEKIAIQMTRKAPERIRRKRHVPKIPENDAYVAACRHVANFLYNHGMEMALFTASVESGGAIPKKSLPVPVGNILGLSDQKHLYMQVLRSVRPPKSNVISRDIKKPHHRHHHHQHHSKKSNLTPTEAYMVSAEDIIRRGPNEIRQLGIDPLDPTAAQQLYDDFKMFLNYKRNKKEEAAAPPPPPQPVYQPAEPLPVPPSPPSVHSSRKSSTVKSVSSRKASTAKSVSTAKSSYIVEEEEEEVVEKPQSSTVKESEAEEEVEEEDEEEDMEEEDEEEDEEDMEEEEAGEE